MQKILFSTMVVIVFGAFVVFKIFLASPEQVPEPPGFDVPISIPSEGLISFKHSFVPRSAGFGEHLYRGVMQLPTPCHRLKSDVAILESFPEQFAFSFIIIEHDGACDQVIAEKQFEVRASGNVRATISSVTVNGEAMQFSVQEEAARVPNPSGVGFIVGEPFVLKLGEEKRGEDIAVRFVGIQSDSRCPENADCFWAGEAIAEFEVSYVGVLDEYVPPRRILLVFPGEEAQTAPGVKSFAVFRNYTIHLAGLAPENTIEQAHSLPYEATLVINSLE